jgi:hypothetical protein
LGLVFVAAYFIDRSFVCLDILTVSVENTNDHLEEVIGDDLELRHDPRTKYEYFQKVISKSPGQRNNCEYQNQVNCEFGLPKQVNQAFYFQSLDAFMRGPLFAWKVNFILEQCTCSKAVFVLRYKYQHSNIHHTYLF